MPVVFRIDLKRFETLDPKSFRFHIIITELIAGITTISAN